MEDISMRTVCILVSCAALLLALAAFALGDVVYMKDGKKFKGEIVKKTDTHVQIRTKSGLKTISRDKIDRIEKTATAVEIDPPDKIPEKDTEPSTGKPGRMMEDGTMEAPEDWIKIKEFKCSTRGPLVLTVKGTVKNFPDDTWLSIAFYFGDNLQKDTGGTFVKKGKFEFVKMTRKKDYFSGHYHVVVTYKPKKQDRDLVKRIEREFGPFRATSEQQVNEAVFVRTPEAREREIQELKEHYTRLLKQLYAMFTGMKDKVKKHNELDKRKFEAAEKDWQEYLKGLWEKCEEIKKEHQGVYGNYYVMRNQSSSRNLVEICEALMRRSASESAKIYQKHEMEVPKEHAKKARASGKRSNFYFMRNLIKPICTEMGIREASIGILPEKENK
jgi:hypothetical protein